MNKLKICEEEVRAAVDRLLKGKTGIDYEQFMRELPSLVKTTDADLLAKAMNNFLWRGELRTWRFKTGVKFIGKNPEYEAHVALPAMASF